MPWPSPSARTKRGRRRALVDGGVAAGGARRFAFENFQRWERRNEALRLETDGDHTEKQGERVACVANGLLRPEVRILRNAAGLVDAAGLALHAPVDCRFAVDDVVVCL